MCTPALPKPIPAKASTAASPRDPAPGASTRPSITDVRNEVASRLIAFSAHMSPIGLAPQ